MKSFKHINAQTVSEAVKLLNGYEGRAKLNAGGTDLLAVLKYRILPEYPEAVINVKTIPGLDYIDIQPEGLKIGALARLADIACSPAVKAKYGLLAKAAEAVATPQIRNMATIGGNLCQDLRCWYYRYPHHVGGRLLCYAKGGDRCYAVAGENQYHSIFGGSGGCVSVNPSDIAVALVALEAKIEITGSGQVRKIPVGEFFGSFRNVLETDEMVTEIEIPQPPEGAKQTFLKFRLREAIDFALVSVASVVTAIDGVCQDARIVLGSVAPAPVRAREAEQTIKGKAINAATVEAAAEAAVAGAKPLSKNAHKVDITKALVRKALLS